MKTTFLSNLCRLLATVLVVGACNSDEVSQASATDGQGGGTDSTSAGASNAATVTDGGASNETPAGSVSVSDSDAGSDGHSASHSTSASAADSDDTTFTTSSTGTDSGMVSATDTDATDTNATDTDTDTTNATDTDGTAGDTTAGDTDAMCDPDLPDDTACQMCMAQNCCEAYTACLEDEACQCVVSKCSAAVLPVTCALVECQLLGSGLPGALMFLQACSQDCNVTCPLVGLL